MKPKEESRAIDRKPILKLNSKNERDVTEVDLEEIKRGTEKLIEKERSRLLEQMKDVIDELTRVKRENEKLRRQQEQKMMGVTAETVDKMRKAMDHAKSTNSFLLRDIEDRKKQVVRLETQTFEMNMKLEAMTKKFNEVKGINDDLKAQVDELTRQTSRAQKVWDENRRLRQILASHHIDSKTGKSQVAGKHIGGKRKAVTIKDALKSKSLESVNRKIAQRSKSMEDIRRLEGYYGGGPNRRGDVGRKNDPHGSYADILRKRRSLQRKQSSY